MKSPHNILLIIFLLFFRFFAVAQCNFNLDVQIIQQATCPANGIVQVTLSGEDVDLNTVLISLNSTNGLINESSTTNGIQFTALPPYDYNVTARTVCKGTQTEVSQTASVTVQSQYDMLNASTGVERESSFACINTGEISFEICDGRLPYDVKFIQTPAAYTGITEFNYANNNVQSIGSLASGNYVMQITDGCLSSVPLTFMVEQMASDFPADPFAANASAVNNSCDGATVSYNELSSGNELYNFWYNRNSYYEVAFTVDGSEKTWLPTNSYSYYGASQSFTLPQSYRSLRASGKPVDVWLRLIGTNCEQKVDALQLNAPANINFTNSNTLTSCSTFDTQFRFSSSTRPALCPPYRWELRNSAGILVDSAGGITDFPSSTSDVNAQKSTGLLVNTDYTLTVFDSEDFQIGTRTFRYSITAPYFYSKSAARNCLTYSLSYSISGNTCFPATRQIFDGNGTLLRTETITSHTAVSALEYDTAYNIVITDAASNVVSFTHNEPHPQYTNRTVTYHCDNYDLSIRPYMFCDTYEWVLTTTDNVVVAQSSGAVAITQNSLVSGLLYGTAYVLKTYNVDRTIYENINTSRPAPYWYDYYDTDLQCADYRHYFAVYSMYCLPYTWEIYDGAGTLVRNGTGTATNQSHNTRLPYNEEFTIKIIDSKGVTVLERKQRLNNTSQSNYSYTTSTSVATPCYTDEIPHRGYMYIYSSNGGIDAGATIRFVSGPQRPLHDNVSFTARSYYFYPFSQNYTQSEQVVIADGDYVFEITDPCGIKHNLTIPFKNSTREMRGFSYTKDDETDLCNGVSRVYPQGKLYENGNPLSSTYFYLMATPSNPSLPRNTTYRRQIRSNDPQPNTTQYFELTQSGKYVIGVTNTTSTSACMFDTIVVNHVRRNPELEGRSSYVCSDGGSGQIIVAAKNGREPYSYELRTEAGVSVPIAANPNATGIFEFGALGENYTVMITDACNRSFPIDIQINSLDQIPFTSGVDRVCAGEQVELSCWMMGAQAYQWSGPNGFTANTRVVNIPNVTVANAGEYTVSVKPFGCADFIHRTHTVNVYAAQPPTVPGLIYVCDINTPYQLTAAPDAGYTLQWFDSAENPLPAAPTVDLTTQAEYTFFVAQTDGELGCQSAKAEVVVTSNVPGDMIVNETVNHSICSSELPYKWRDITIPTGTVSDVFVYNRQTVLGCDSIVTLNLTVNPVYNQTENIALCESDLPYTFRDIVFPTGTVSNDYVYNRKTVHTNCDSIVTVRLTVHPAYSQTENITICSGQLPYTFRDIVFPAGTVSNDYVYNRKTVHTNCDSIVTVRLNVFDAYNQTENITICQSDLPYSFRDIVFPTGTASNDYVYNRKTVHTNCDSIVTVRLTVQPAYNQMENIAICESDLPYTFRDITFPTGTVSNDYVYNRKTKYTNCDSIVTVRLTIHPIYNQVENTTICNNDLPYTFRDIVFPTGTTSNDYVYNRKTKHTNCDSIVTVRLTVHPVYNQVENITICESDLPYTFRDIVFPTGTISNDYVYNRKTVHTNCDSVVTVRLTVHPAYNQVENIAICESDLPYTFRDIIFPAGTVSNDYVYNRKTVHHNCDSIVTVRLAVHPTYNQTENISICSSDLPYTFRDIVFPAGTVSNDYVYNRKTQHTNCDSIVTVRLTIQPVYSQTENITICSSDLPYTFRDIVFPVGTVSNDYVYNRKTVHTNCDSIVTVRLTVHPAYSQVESVAICESDLPYTFRDIIFPTGTVSDVFVYNSQTVLGCDSIVTLNLTVNPVYNQIENIAICESDLPYTFRDITFPTGTVSNVFVYNRQTVFGCDSIVTLNLTVNPVYNQTENIVICESDLPYTFRDITFPTGTVSDVFVYNRQTVLGCDSIITVKLTVHQISYDVKDVVICQGESYDLRNSIINLQNTEVRFYHSPNETGEGILPIVSPAATTTYYVRADNSMGCQVDKSIQITVANKPAIGLISEISTVCEGEKINLTPPSVDNGGAFITNQRWLLDGVPFDMGTNISYSNNNQTLKYIAENNCGISSSNEIILSVYEYPDLKFPEYNVCLDNGIELLAPESKAYLWLPVMSTQQNPTVYPTETTVYTLRLINDFCYFEYPVSVNVLPLPEEVIIRQSGLGQVSINGGKDYIYQLNDDVPTSKTVFNLSSGYHSLEIRNTYGCAIRQSFIVHSLEIPPYFSPNGDGINDEWIIEGLSAFPETKVYIYTREGKLLDTLDANRPAWNGKFNGQDMPSTDYWYLLEMPEFRETETGHFTLKR